MISEFVDRQAANADLYELEDVLTGEKRQYRIVSKATVTVPGTDLNKATLDPILEAILSTSGIADSGGSASTGYWVKYDDGTMICYKSTTQRPTISNQAGGMYRSAMISLGSFPQTFSGTPRVKPVMYHNSGYYLLITESNNYNASSAGEAAVFSPTSITGTSGPLMDIGYIAIGRWK